MTTRKDFAFDNEEASVSVDLMGVWAALKTGGTHLQQEWTGRPERLAAEVDKILPKFVVRSCVLLVNGSPALSIFNLNNVASAFEGKFPSDAIIHVGIAMDPTLEVGTIHLGVLYIG